VGGLGRSLVADGRHRWENLMAVASILIFCIFWLMARREVGGFHTASIDRATVELKVWEKWWYTKMLLMTVGDKTCLKFMQEFTQVFEMQNLKVLQDSFKKSEILQILEMLHFKIIQIFRLLT
jgi:hypothetical protein